MRQQTFDLTCIHDDDLLEKYIPGKLKAMEKREARNDLKERINNSSARILHKFDKAYLFSAYSLYVNYVML